MSNSKIAIVSPGGGGDNALALAIATFSSNYENTIALGAINPQKSYKPWLITKKFTDIVKENCPERTGLTLPEYKEYFKTHFTIDDEILQINNKPISNEFKKKIGQNKYNSLLEECITKNMFLDTTFYGFPSIGGISKKYYGFDGKPMNDTRLIPQLKIMINVLKKFLIKYEINELRIIDVGGDIINDLKNYDIYKMGRDALSLLAFLYIKQNYLPDLEIKINIYGIGVDGSDYPNNIIKSLKEYGFEEDTVIGKNFYKIIDKYNDIFEDCGLLKDRRATGILNNSILTLLPEIVKGLKDRREKKSSEIATEFNGTLGIFGINDTKDERFYDKDELLFSKCYSLNNISKIIDITDVLPNSELIIEFNIIEKENEIIKFLSFNPSRDEINKLCKQSNYAVNILNEGILVGSDKKSLVLSKVANKPYAFPKKMVADHPSETLLSKSDKQKYIKNIPFGIFAILEDLNCPLINNSCGPNIIFVPRNEIINFFNNNIYCTQTLINELILYRNENYENIWNTYIQHIIKSKDEIEKISPYFYEFFKIIHDNNVSMEESGFGIVSFCQTWMKKNENIGNANFSIMSPHSQQKFYVKNVSKFTKFIKLYNIRKEHLREYFRINCLFKNKMKDYYGAFVNLNEVYEELNKEWYTVYYDYYYENYINYYYEKLLGYFDFNYIYNIVRMQFEY